MPGKRKKADEENIKCGMDVEATKGDLGEEDVSKPKVSAVTRNKAGEVEELTVQKGVIFKKTLDIPADRVQSVDADNQDENSSGKVIVDVSKEEAASLTAVGEEALFSEEQKGLLEKVERDVPTAESLHRLEISNSARRVKRKHARLVANKTQPSPQESSSQASEAGDGKTTSRGKGTHFLFHVLGPGFLGGMAGNDASAVGAYSVDGATNGYGHLWLLLLSTPLYQSVQFACAKLGRITQKGLAEILREHYSRKIAIPASLILIVANLALIAADLVAIGSGIELITGVSWVWFVVPVAVILWYLTVYRSFESIKKIFIVMSLAFVTYFITAIFSHANWGAVLFNTFVPHVNFGFASISSAVALLGATISPYTMFWQVQGEKEEKRSGTTRQKVHSAALDIAIGVVSGNLISYFIIVCTAATLFAHHQGITTAADVARSLEPLLGPFAKYLFAIGFIGAGLVAIPVLLASTSYAVAGTIGWPSGLAKKPWQNEGFYLILTAALLISLVIALLHFDPIRLIFWANVLSGVLSPILIVYLIIIGNNRKIMHNECFSLITNIGLVVAALVMFTAAVLLFYGLATGQTG
ncbi:MAG TPA: divalent metal cation transporter [Ktedonobacteraceae bacterium]|nr:divalent metal cation transporter [Ktedonobacteraceae bacterium]